MPKMEEKKKDLSLLTGQASQVQIVYGGDNDMATLRFSDCCAFRLGRTDDGQAVIIS